MHGPMNIKTIVDYHSIMDKTPTHALFTQHYISLAC